MTSSILLASLLLGALLVSGVDVIGDTAADIQTAIDSASDGDTVFLGTKTYTSCLIGGIVVSKNITLSGDSFSSTILDCENGNKGFRVYAGNVTFELFAVTRCNSGPAFDIDSTNGAASVVFRDMAIYGNSVTTGNVGGVRVFRTSGEEAVSVAFEEVFFFENSQTNSVAHVRINNACFVSFVGCFLSGEGVSILTHNLLWMSGTSGARPTVVANSTSFVDHTTNENSIFVNNGDLHLHDCFIGNISAIAAVLVQVGALSATETTFTDTSGPAVRATNAGSAVFSGCSFLYNSGDGAAVNLANGAETVVFTDCQFISNSALVTGGALYVQDGVAIASDCTFISNSADQGGAIYLTADGAVVASDCAFTGNVAANRGAACSSRGNATFERCTFDDNVATNRGGCIDTSGASNILSVASCQFRDNEARVEHGGAVSVNGCDATQILDCEFSGNSAAKLGGAVVWGGSCPGQIVGSIFADNLAESGAGVHSACKSRLEVAHTTFQGNAAELDGGGLMHVRAGPLDVVGCLFLSNVAGSQSANSLVRDGGGMFVSCEGVNVSVVNVTFHENIAGNGGGLTVRNAHGVHVHGATFQGNYATDLGGALVVDSVFTATLEQLYVSDNDADMNGGALAVRSTVLTTVSEATFVHNDAASISGSGGAVYTESHVVFVDCVLSENAANRGGAVYAKGLHAAPANVTFRECLLQGNSAMTGGALYIDESFAEVRESDLVGNDASGDGGAVFIGKTGGGVAFASAGVFGNYATGSGGALVCDAEASGAVTTDLAGGFFLNNVAGIRADGPAIDCRSSGCLGCRPCVCPTGACDMVGESGQCGVCWQGYTAVPTCDVATGLHTSTLSALPSIMRAGEAATFLVEVRDIFDNLEPREDMAINVTFPRSSAVLRNLFNGTVLVTLTTYAGTGRYDLVVTVDDLLVTTGVVTIPVLGAPALANLTEVASLGPFPASEESASLVLKLFDRYGNPTIAGNVTATAGGETSMGVPFIDSFIVVVLFNARVAGLLEFDVFVNGERVPGPISVTVVPGAAYGGASTANGTGLTSGVVGRTSHFVVTTKDRFGNALTVSDGSVLEVDMFGAGAPEVVVVDNGDGTFSVTFVPAVSAVYTLVIKLNEVELPQSEGGQLQCVVRLLSCSAGRILPAGGIGECTECDYGSFAALTNQTQCTGCPASTTTPHLGAKSRADCTCMAGFFVLGGVVDDACMDCQPCAECPAGAVCPGAMAEPYAEPGFWKTQDDDGSPLFVQCRPSSLCLGGEENGCKEGHVGFACASCAEDYYLANVNECKKCGGGAAAAVALFVVAFIASIAVGMAVSFYATYVPPGGDLPADLDLSPFKQLVTYFQILALVIELPLGWPQGTVTVLYGASFFNFNPELLSPECSLPSSYESKFVLVILAPLFVALAVLSVVAAVMLARFVCGRVGASFPIDDDGMRFFSRVTSKKVFVFLFMMTYIIVTKTALSLFDCTLEVDGRYHLGAQRELVCYDAWWLALMPFALLALLLYSIGGPLLLAYKIKSRGLATDYAHSVAFGGVYKRYKPSLYLWELCFFFQKLSFVIFQVFLSSNVPAQCALLMVVMAGNSFAISTYYPFARPVMNQSAIALDTTITLVLFAGMIFYSEKIDDSMELALSAFVISITIAGGLAGCAVFLFDQALPLASRRWGKPKKSAYAASPSQTSLADPNVSFAANGEDAIEMEAVSVADAEEHKRPAPAASTQASSG